MELTFDDVVKEKPSVKKSTKKKQSVDNIPSDGGIAFKKPSVGERKYGIKKTAR